jgi:hypothetical protein
MGGRHLPRAEPVNIKGAVLREAPLLSASCILQAHLPTSSLRFFSVLIHVNYFLWNGNPFIPPDFV